MSSPTARSLKEARKLGLTAQVVERWNPHSKTRHDLFDCIDIVAVHPDCGIIGIQACAGASHAARAEKIRQSVRMQAWLASGGRAEVWSWSKRGARGKAKHWTLRREEIRKDGAK
jgi:hypothetical protein